MTTLLNEAKNMLTNDETILFYTACSLEIFIYRSVARPPIHFNKQKALLLWSRCKQESIT